MYFFLHFLSTFFYIFVPTYALLCVRTCFLLKENFLTSFLRWNLRKIKKKRKNSTFIVIINPGSVQYGGKTLYLDLDPHENHCGF